MTNELGRLFGKLIIALLMLFCLGIALVTAALAIGAVIAMLASVIGVTLLIGLAVSVTIYVYPFCHNGGLALSDRLHQQLDAVPHVRALTASRAFFNTATWLAIVGGAFLLPGALLGDLGASRLSAEATLGAAGLLSLCPGAIFGLALSVWSDPLDCPGGGPLAQLIEAAHNRFG